MLTVDKVVKVFDGTRALDEVQLILNEGELLAVLGPSGCGKSTLLRVIAGVETPDGGRVLWDGTDLSPLPPHRRRFGLMFQGYALFPHLNVGENVAFGLRMDHRDRPEINQRVTEALSRVGLEGMERRRIEGLSGGEQQRVALARTLAPAPRLVMLDEPLGALDRTLRRRLVQEIPPLLHDQQATAIYVTHDHEEAEAVADRVALMRAGRIIQTGTFAEIRQKPADSWVEEFVGS